jgi:hypothetical protein
MKAKDFIIIGGAIALYYLYQKNKTKTSTTSTEEEAQDEQTSTGGVGGGGGGSMPIKSTPITVTPIILTTNGGTTSGSLAVPTKVKGGSETTEAIFTGATDIIPRPIIPSKPTTVDGTIRSISNPAPIETPIEVAIQQGGASTIPRPIIPSEPSALIKNDLINQNIQPIIKNTRSI